MSGEEKLSDEELYDQILDEIETTLDVATDNLELEVEDGFVTMWGSVPNIRDSEELEKLLFDGLGLENVDFDVVIDEGIQTTEEAMNDQSPQSREGFDITPEEKSFDDYSEPRRQI